MTASALPGGTVHPIVPEDFARVIMTHAQVRTLWHEITPLARNEWICWVTAPKQASTRQRRIEVGISKLTSGMRRPCCWSGCPHRERNGS